MARWMPGTKRGQQGQSLVEVCVACIALVPLAIGLVYMGQYIHVKQTVQQAAREAAWDAAVSPSIYRKDSPDLAMEQTRLRARYFGDASKAIGPAANVPGAFTDAMLGDYSGRQLLDPGNLSIAIYSNEKAPGPEGAVEGVIGQITGALSSAFSSLGLNKHGAAFPPDSEGYITASVSAKTNKANNFDPLDKLDLDFHSQTVLLADAWDADGGGENNSTGEFDAGGAPIPDRTVRSQITYLTPGTAVFGGSVGSLLNKVVSFVGSIPVLDDLFPGFKDHGLQLGRTAPDVVPYDKLKPYKQ